MTGKRQHILLMRLSSVGDVVLATPVVEYLRTQSPSARVTWLVDQGYQDLVQNNPHVDQVMSFDYTGRHQGPAGIRRLARELGRVDMLIDLQHKVRTILLSTALKPNQRRVLVKRRGFGLIRALVGRDVILKAPHQIDRYFQVLDSDWKGRPPCPLLKAGKTDQRRADELLDGCLAQRPLVGIFPGSRHPNKRWPARSVAALADRCHREGLGVMMLGGPDDHAQARAAVECMEHSPDSLQTGGSLGVLAGMISRCAVVVSPDSGPAHMAAALGVPVVTLFGPTSHERWAPVGPACRVVRVELPCSPCSNHGGSSCPLGTLECMQAITPEQVWRTVSELLERAS